MTQSILLEEIQQEYLKKDVTDFRVGDTVSVHVKIVEGSKERIQIFTGTVIARKGRGLSETFTLHRVAYGEGMERVFSLHNPHVAKIDLVKEGKVRRAKLNYLKGTTGKAAKVKERVGPSRKKKQLSQSLNQKAPKEAPQKAEKE